MSQKKTFSGLSGSGLLASSPTGSSEALVKDESKKSKQVCSHKFSKTFEAYSS